MLDWVHCYLSSTCAQISSKTRMLDKDVGVFRLLPSYSFATSAVLAILTNLFGTLLITGPFRRTFASWINSSLTHLHRSKSFRLYLVDVGYFARNHP